MTDFLTFEEQSAVMGAWFDHNREALLHRAAKALCDNRSDPINHPDRETCAHSRWLAKVALEAALMVKT